MVQHVNSGWKSHVAETGVTCYTCHRGQPVPSNVWFNDPGPTQAGGMAQMPAGKNHPTAVANSSSLPVDPFTPFLEQDNNIRVQSSGGAAWNGPPVDQADRLDLFIDDPFLPVAWASIALIVITRRALSDWSQSPPQRVTAWYGIRMVRDLNNNYLDPLRCEPSRRPDLGPTGDSAKGELRDLSPGRLQTTVRCQYGKGFSGIDRSALVKVGNATISPGNMANQGLGS